MRKAADRSIMRHSIRRTIRSLLPILPLIFSLGPTLWSAAPLRSEAPAEDQLRLWISQATRPAYPGVPFTFDRNDFNEDTSGLPIGIFDSGIGGLTVMEAILSSDGFDNDTLEPTPDGRWDFEGETFIYLGDQANMPYGNYAPSGKEDYLRELILKDAIFLLGRRAWPGLHASAPVFHKKPVKAIVIACNTATAYGLNDIRGAIKSWDIPVPVIGVVEAGARQVSEQLGASKHPTTVAILATTGTCSSLAYPKAIGAAVGLAGKRVPSIVQQGSIGLAGAIEGDPAYLVESPTARNEHPYQGPSLNHQQAPFAIDDLQHYGFDPRGMLGDPSQPATWQLNSLANYARYDVASLVQRHRRTQPHSPIEMVVLGCTHFPLVHREILAAFAELRNYQENGEYPYRTCIAEHIQVVDPAALTARELFRTLARQRLAVRRNSQRTSLDHFFISVPSPLLDSSCYGADGGLAYSYKYGRATGQLTLEDTRCVPLMVADLPSASRQLLERRLPHVWQRLSLADQGESFRPSDSSSRP
jgi:glutamate racemase